MAIDDITYNLADEFIVEITGINSPISDALFVPTGIFVVEVNGANGSATDILFDPSMTYEIMLTGGGVGKRFFGAFRGG